MQGLVGSGNVDLSKAITLPTVTVSTDKKTDNVLLITAGILAFGLIAAAVIGKKK